MRFCSLGSGSDGNALLVGSDSTGYLLLDCGLSLREFDRRLAVRGLQPGALRGVLVTHEHGDHLGSAAQLAQRERITLYTSRGTQRAARGTIDPALYVEVDDGVPFEAAGLEITPFSVPHDAAEPLQFTFRSGHAKLGVLTDLGHVTPYVTHALQGCDGLVLECNHDAQLLADGPYPPALKRRIGGGWGHLPNHVAAQLLASVAHDTLHHVIAAHLSKQNNRPELAQRALAQVLGCADDDVQVAAAAGGFDWRDLR
ncbi:MAG: MBL fold metallo-hydrolase [Betaproteobacteria bacterium]|nr:MBL fold metallo-hydrolase [Betaproteobacteria bacterium]